MTVTPGLILSAAWQHLYLSILGTLLGGALGFVVAVLSRRRPRVVTVFMSLAEIIQTFPSIALLAILLLVFGLGNPTLIVALGLYGIMPVLQNTYEGIRSVDPMLLDIATGMGMTKGQILRRVELPIALPFILAGFRVSLVTAIGIATIGVFVGAGGLGLLIYRGLQMIDNTIMLEGAIPAALLAILVELLGGYAERRLAKR
ncbi:MAG: ABC transporter permease [Alicyclobacillus sp.]|nr:ABC transporter permease [Alicyclobacillus sp.]